MTLFLTAHLVCTRYDQNGGAGSSFPIDITGTGSDTMYPSGADCPTGQQVVKIIADTGAGLDSIQLYCAPTVCS
jgi:hypothetical protein